MFANETNCFKIRFMIRIKSFRVIVLILYIGINLSKVKLIPLFINGIQYQIYEISIEIEISREKTKSRKMERIR